MKLRMVMTAAALVCLATTAVADLSRESLDFANGPLTALLTQDEAAKWKSIHEDADAKAFVALFWARRDPTPDTPRNEYREKIEQLVGFADENFKGEKVR